MIFFTSSGVVGVKEKEFRIVLSKYFLYDFFVAGWFLLTFFAIQVKYLLNDSAINFLSEVRFPLTSKAIFEFLFFNFDEIKSLIPNHIFLEFFRLLLKNS